MRVLLDANIPRAYAALLPGHRIDTVHQRQWSEMGVGELRLLGPDWLHAGPARP